jgi:hypothetical protein
MDYQYHDNFYDCRTNNCSCYKPIDYFDTSNNFNYNNDSGTTTCNDATTSNDSGTTT